MSLKVWLPLDGNLKNLGASGTEIISNGVATDINGKIGSCYSFSPDNSSYLRLNTAPFDNNTTEFSFTCWFKPNTSHIGCLFSNRSSTVATGITLWYYNSVFYFDAGDRWSSVSNASATIGAWNHLAFTWKLNGKKRIYVNGNIVGEENATTALTSATIGTAFIGAAQTTASHDTVPGSSYFNGYLNDVRIYDHALSAAEVHEIAMGLIAHYKLNDPMNGIGKNYLVNLIDNTSNFHRKMCTYDYKDGNYTLTVTDVGEFQQIWNDNLITDTSNFVGKDIMVSYENITTTDSSADIRVYLRCTNSSSEVTSYIINNYATKITLPEDIVKIGILFRCDQQCNSPIGTVATFSKFKLEIGDKATAWIPPEYPYEENNLIIDSSGYNHFATTPSALATTSDTPRYSTATTFDGTDYCDIHDVIFGNDHLASELTWSGWIKPTINDGVAGRRVYYGIIDVLLYTNNNLRFRWVHSNIDYSYSVTNTWEPGIIIPHNNWTHIALTFKDGYLKAYINGEYGGYSDRTGNGQYIRTHIGHYLGASSDTANQWIGDISDMRIYTTALLDNDIKLLYNMGMRVDNLGRVHTFEFNETINEKLLKTGILQSNELEETSAQLAKLKENKGWLSPNFIEI